MADFVSGFGLLIPRIYPQANADANDVISVYGWGWNSSGTRNDQEFIRPTFQNMPRLAQFHMNFAKRAIPGQRFSCDAIMAKYGVYVADDFKAVCLTSVHPDHVG